jgi:hypothetical protein
LRITLNKLKKITNIFQLRDFLQLLSNIPFILD